MWAPVEGRYGRTRDGRKVGPIVPSGRGDLWPWEARGPSEAPGIGVPLWTATGSYFPSGEDHPLDLVAEWVEDVETLRQCWRSGQIPEGEWVRMVRERPELAVDGPVRTVTRQEIAPGEYDHVIVETIKNDPYGPRVGVGIGARNQYLLLNADELDAAARVLSQLAEALRNG